MRAAATVVSLLLLSVLGPGCRGDRDKCAAAAQHFAELVYWERENKAIEQLPKEQQDAARRQKLADFSRELDSQLELRISHCVSAGADDQADCINGAKTAAGALECADLAKGPNETKSGLCAAARSGRT